MLGIYLPIFPAVPLSMALHPQEIISRSMVVRTLTTLENKRVGTVETVSSFQEVFSLFRSYAPFVKPCRDICFFIKISTLPTALSPD